MKTRWSYIIVGLTLSLLCLAQFTGSTSAAVDWEDNFDDGNYDGWTVLGYENTTSLATIPGNFSASSGTLTVLDDDINVARHNSTMSVGTWSFDMFVPDDGDGVIDLMFMSNGSRPYYFDPTPIFASSFVSVEAWIDMSRFDIWGMAGVSGRLFDTWSPVLQGWHHIDVSRTSGGRILVYFNGTLRADFDNNVVSTSTYLEIWCLNATGAMIDNIVVDDTPLPIPSTTTTTTNGGTTPPPTSIPWDLVAIIGGMSVVVIVLVIVVLRRR
ncbi:MAG: hypothetical protein RTV41_11100 [Candidatus Thorarchaeota archaeon]